jgi:hypothetical protein
MAPYEDPIVEEVHATRAKLLKKYGGAQGYAQHLRELETQLKNRIVTRKPRPPAKVVKKVS